MLLLLLSEEDTTSCRLGGGTRPREEDGDGRSWQRRCLSRDGGRHARCRQGSSHNGEVKRHGARLSVAAGGAAA